MSFYFITHPNVVVSRDVPVPRWPLSEPGRQRMRAGLKQPWVRELSAIYCSTEQKFPCVAGNARWTRSRASCVR